MSRSLFWEGIANSLLKELVDILSSHFISEPSVHFQALSAFAVTVNPVSPQGSSDRFLRRQYLLPRLKVNYVGRHSAARECYSQRDCNQWPSFRNTDLTYTTQAAQAGAPLANGAHPATPIKTKPRIEKNRVLVTGGAGFVGSHLCTYLVERGDHVCILQQIPSLPYMLIYIFPH